jgi:hypothetical protein
MRNTVRINSALRIRTSGTEETPGDIDQALC